MKAITEKTAWYVAPDGKKFLSEAECLKHERADPVGFLSRAFKIDEALFVSIIEGREPALADALRAIMGREFKARKAGNRLMRTRKPADYVPFDEDPDFSEVEPIT